MLGYLTSSGYQMIFEIWWTYYDDDEDYDYLNVSEFFKLAFLGRIMKTGRLVIRLNI
jgi:hypothetical protein